MSTSLGKLFNTILYNRLPTKLQNANILSPAQGGFRKDYRILDRIFTLFSLIKKYATKGKYLYTCVVGFQKAYDSIWRDGLKDKLEKIGINGKFVDIIQPKYEAPNISLLYSAKLQSHFKQLLGLSRVIY